MKVKNNTTKSNNVSC